MKNRSSSSERIHTARIKTTPQITLQVNDTFDNYFFLNEQWMFLQPRATIKKQARQK